MADKEPRKRKRRKENQKRDDADETPQQKDNVKFQRDRSPSEDRSHDIGHEPSIFAKSVFFILFSLLIVAVGVIFFTLHGVQRDSLDDSKDSFPESGFDEHGELRSAMPLEFSFDDHRSQEETHKIEPSSVQDVLDDLTDEPKQIEPSEMHPWAEYIPEEKPDDGQNIFDQIYEALQEDGFQDDILEDELSEVDDDGEEIMEDSFFKVDDVEDDERHKADAQGTDDFDVQVIAQDIEISQSLLDIDPDTVSEDTPATVDDLELPNSPVHPKTQTSDEPDVLNVNDPNSQDFFVRDYAGDLEMMNKDDEDDFNDINDDRSRIDDSASFEWFNEQISENVGDNILPASEHSRPSPVDDSSQNNENSQIVSEEVKIDWPEHDQVIETARTEQHKENPTEEQAQSTSHVEPSSHLNPDVKESAYVEPEVVDMHDEDVRGDDLSDSRGDMRDEEEDDETKNEINEEGPEIVVDDEPAQESQQKAEQPYENADITNEYDFLFKEDIDEADRIVEKSPETALKMFDMLATKHPKSPRVTYGRAKCQDKLAEVHRKNAYLDQAIDGYRNVLGLADVPDALYLLAGNRCVQQLRFRGYVGKAVILLSQMAAKYPTNMDIQNQLGVSYLWMGNGSLAKTAFEKVLKARPGNGFAKVHLGFILKTEESRYQEAISLMRDGIASREEGVIDGRFYFHLGDALARVGKPRQAMLVYEEGVKEGVFLSAYQRSLYNVDTLTGKPWWNPEDTPYNIHIQTLEANWELIRNEALSLINSTTTTFIAESEGLRDTGDWKQFELFSRGRKIEKNCHRAPRTCKIVENIPDASGCRRGQVKFSIMQPGTHVWAHTGPTNCRIRAHLGLVVPEGPRLRVANETKTWTEGKVIIFDDSFEHEVWHDGASFRLVLIADFWHPELTPQQKATLSPI